MPACQVKGQCFRVRVSMSQGVGHCSDQSQAFTLTQDYRYRTVLRFPASLLLIRLLWCWTYDIARTAMRQHVEWRDADTEWRQGAIVALDQHPKSASVSYINLYHCPTRDIQELDKEPLLFQTIVIGEKRQKTFWWVGASSSDTWCLMWWDAPCSSSGSSSGGVVVMAPEEQV